MGHPGRSPQYNGILEECDEASQQTTEKGKGSIEYSNPSSITHSYREVAANIPANQPVRNVIQNPASPSASASSSTTMYTIYPGQLYEQLAALSQIAAQPETVVTTVQTMTSGATPTTSGAGNSSNDSTVDASQIF
jgi:hypothetical protein